MAESLEKILSEFPEILKGICESKDTRDCKICGDENCSIEYGLVIIKRDGKIQIAFPAWDEEYKDFDWSDTLQIPPQNEKESLPEYLLRLKQFLTDKGMI